jgi:hypothetical protein
MAQHPSVACAAPCRGSFLLLFSFWPWASFMAVPQTKKCSADSVVAYLNPQPLSPIKNCAMQEHTGL